MDDFDTKVTCEEYYDEADEYFHNGWVMWERAFTLFGIMITIRRMKKVRTPF